MNMDYRQYYYEHRMKQFAVTLAQEVEFYASALLLHHLTASDIRDQIFRMTRAAFDANNSFNIENAWEGDDGWVGLRQITRDRCWAILQLPLRPVGLGASFQLPSSESPLEVEGLGLPFQPSSESPLEVEVLGVSYQLPSSERHTVTGISGWRNPLTREDVVPPTHLINTPLDELMELAREVSGWAHHYRIDDRSRSEKFDDLRIFIMKNVWHKSFTQISEAMEIRRREVRRRYRVLKRKLNEEIGTRF